MVERQLPKLNVAGSIPVSRSNKISNLESTRSNLNPHNPHNPHNSHNAAVECFQAEIPSRFHSPRKGLLGMALSRPGRMNQESCPVAECPTEAALWKHLEPAVARLNEGNLAPIQMAPTMEDLIERYIDKHLCKFS